MPVAPASPLHSSLCALGNAMAAVMDMALYNLVLLRARPRQHPRRKSRALFHPARDMRTFPVHLLLSAQVVEAPAAPRFMEFATENAYGDLLLHPHETLAHIGGMMNQVNAIIQAGQHKRSLARELAKLAAMALWMKHFLANARHHLHAPEPGPSGNPASLAHPRRHAPCSWQADSQRMDRLTGEDWQLHIANLPDPWSEMPKIALHPLTAGKRIHGVWMPQDMAAALTALATHHRTTADAVAMR